MTLADRASGYAEEVNAWTGVLQGAWARNLYSERIRWIDPSSPGAWFPTCANTGRNRFEQIELHRQIRDIQMEIGKVRRNRGLRSSEKVEQDLMKIIPQDRWVGFGHQVIHHGRRLCPARKPLCADCPLDSLCDAPDKTM